MENIKNENVWPLLEHAENIGRSVGFADLTELHGEWILYLYGRIWHRHVDKVVEEIIGEAERMMCWPMYCEDNGDKGFFCKEIRRGALRKDLYGAPEQGDQDFQLSAEMVAEHRFRAGDGSGLY